MPRPEAHTTRPLRRYIRHQEVDLLHGVWPCLWPPFRIYSPRNFSGSFHVRGFHLYAPKSLSRIQNEVVTLTFAPGLGHAESQAGGFEHESAFRPTLPAVCQCLSVAYPFCPARRVARRELPRCLSWPQLKRRRRVRAGASCSGGRTFQVRSAGVGRARISDAPGPLTNRAGNSLRLLTGQAPESRVL